MNWSGVWLRGNDALTTSEEGLRSGPQHLRRRRKGKREGRKKEGSRGGKGDTKVILTSHHAEVPFHLSPAHHCPLESLCVFYVLLFSPCCPLVSHCLILISGNQSLVDR